MHAGRQQIWVSWVSTAASTNPPSPFSMHQRNIQLLFRKPKSRSYTSPTCPIFRSAKAATAAGRATRFKLPHPRFLLSTNPVSKLLQPAFKSLKMPSTNDCCSSSEMIRVDLDASKKLLFKSSKNQSDRSCSGFSLISSRSINSGLLLLATDHHVVEEESKTTRKTPAFSNSVNSWDFLSSSSCSFFFWESVSSCSSFSRPG